MQLLQTSHLFKARVEVCSAAICIYHHQQLWMCCRWHIQVHSLPLSNCCSWVCKSSVGNNKQTNMKIRNGVSTGATVLFTNQQTSSTMYCTSTCTYSTHTIHSLNILKISSRSPCALWNCLPARSKGSIFSTLY